MNSTEFINIIHVIRLNQNSQLFVGMFDGVAKLFSFVSHDFEIIAKILNCKLYLTTKPAKITPFATQTILNKVYHLDDYDTIFATDQRLATFECTNIQQLMYTEYFVVLCVDNQIFVKKYDFKNYIRVILPDDVVIKKIQREFDNIKFCILTHQNIMYVANISNVNNINEINADILEINPIITCDYNMVIANFLHVKRLIVTSACQIYEAQITNSVANISVTNSCPDNSANYILEEYANYILEEYFRMHNRSRGWVGSDKVLATTIGIRSFHNNFYLFCFAIGDDNQIYCCDTTTRSLTPITKPDFLPDLAITNIMFFRNAAWIGQILICCDNWCYVTKFCQSTNTFELCYCIQDYSISDFDLQRRRANMKRAI